MLISLLFSIAYAQSIIEPPPGKHFFGAWLDTADSSPTTPDGDRPLKFNQRMGFNFSLFQYGQDIPIPANSFPYPSEQIDATGTDAVVLLTVYPRPSPWTITDADIQALADQCASINLGKRRILLRFGAEMNGNWNYWGQQPSMFIALWKRVHDAIKAKAPLTAMVWAPSSGNGYPYTTISGSNSDFTLLDTNKDGVVNANDDPYSPYYPGDEYVDWVGMSIYSYGSRWPWSDNIIAPPGKFETILNDHNFYNVYALGKNKPFMVSETNAAYHTNTPLGPGVGQLATAQSWWTQFSTNATFLSSYPQVKAICLFEFLKYEETFADGTPSLRDFRISNSTEIRNAFLRDFESVKSLYVAGNYSQLVTVSSTTKSIMPTASPNNNDKNSTGNKNDKNTNDASSLSFMILFVGTLFFSFF